MKTGRNSIPEWSSDGILPPINVVSSISPDRSPYVISLPDFVRRFGGTPHRRDRIRGFLQFRSELHKIGLVNGFQWINGSFLENIEEIEKREPNDIDVVTFYYSPDGETQHSLYQSNPALFTPTKTKIEYMVDAYSMPLDYSPDILVKQSAYWYSMWSHRRDGLWKGFVQIDLCDNDDGEAMTILEKMNNEGGTL